MVKRYDFGMVPDDIGTYMLYEEHRSAIANLEAQFQKAISLAYQASRDLYRGPPRNPDHDREADITAKIDKMCRDFPLETPPKYGTCPVCGGMGGAHFTTCRHSPVFKEETRYNAARKRFAKETVRQPDKYAAHHPQCEWRKFEGQAICNCADFSLETGTQPPERICPTCGNKFSGADDRFCPKCHAKDHAGSPLGDDLG